MSIKNIGPLYRLHKENICTQRNITTAGLVDGEAIDKLENRAALLTLLDVILDEHREKYSSILNPLRGRAALTHLILSKYKWPIEHIESMSILHSVLAIQDELKLAESTNVGKDFLERISADYYTVPFEDFPDTDWDPVTYERLQSQRY